MTTLKELMEERLKSRPDKHTIEWWKDQFDQVGKGYRGLTHACNCLLAQMEDRAKTIDAMDARIQQLETSRDEDRAVIGQLQSEVTELMESREKAREAYANLKKQVTSSPPPNG